MRRKGISQGIPVPTEHEEQTTVVEWLEINRIEFFAVPNGGSRSKITKANGKKAPIEGVKLKAEGVKKGVPDLIIIDHPPADPRKRGTVVEMKRREGGRVSPEQKEWRERFIDRGWEHTFADGAGEAIAFLRALGYGRRRA